MHVRISPNDEPATRARGGKWHHGRTWRATITLLASTAITCLLGAAGVIGQAQPPNRFYGSAKVNGADQPDGTVVEAYVGQTLCGSGTVQNRDGSLVYFVDVLGAGQKPGCAQDGDKVTFKLAGLDANESGSYATAAATLLDLTASGTARAAAPPTVLAPGAGSTPAPPPTFVPAPTQPPPPAPTTSSSPSSTPAASASSTPASNASTATPGAAGTPTGEPSPTPAARATRAANGLAADSSFGPVIVVLFAVIALLALAIGATVWVNQHRRVP